MLGKSNIGMSAIEALLLHCINTRKSSWMGDGKYILKASNSLGKGIDALSC